MRIFQLSEEKRGNDQFRDFPMHQYIFRNTRMNQYIFRDSFSHEWLFFE